MLLRPAHRSLAKCLLLRALKQTQQQQAPSASGVTPAALPATWGLLAGQARVGSGSARGFASQPAADDSKLPQLPPFDYMPLPYTGPPKEEVLALRKRFLSPCE